MQTSAEVVLRLLLMTAFATGATTRWSEEVRANLVYRDFTRIGDQKVPDAKRLARLGQLLGAEVIEELHKRIVRWRKSRGDARGHRPRGYHGGVETNIHYPTDSSLLGDGTRKS